jgi:polygalacturonase
VGNGQSLLPQSMAFAKDRVALARDVTMRFPLVLAFVCPVFSATVEVKSAGELRPALRSLKSGDTLKIGPGEYPAGHYVENIEKLTIEALDPENPPHFRGGKEAWHFVRCAGLTLRNLRVSGQSANGINLDDGGRMDQPVDGIVLEGLVISDIGPNGNFDAIKCSGLRNLTIRDCEISGWGGQAIDFVGCRKALITGCRITGKPGFSQHTGPQFKGGCEDIVIEKCHFKDAGPRPVQAGGSTGVDYFRPPGAKYEARRIIIRDNVFEGGMCAAAFTGVDGAEFTGNTVKNPDKWIFRVLQETKEEGFAPCRNVVISGNTFVFQRAKVREEINIGPDTAPETFTFANNHWLAEDKPEESKPKLPVAETGGRYGE